MAVSFNCSLFVDPCVGAFGLSLQVTKAYNSLPPNLQTLCNVNHSPNGQFYHLLPDEVFVADDGSVQATLCGFVMTPFWDIKSQNIH